MSKMTIKIKDNSSEVANAFKMQAAAALEEIGLRAEGYAVRLTPVGTPESTGVVGYSTNGLKQSITHKVSGNAVYIGTNKKHAAYVELGTGIYASDGKGKKNPWIWVDKNGKGHWTRGMKPHHMLKKAASEHGEEYKNVIKKHLKNG